MKTAIDWSKAPEGCIGYSVSSCMSNYWVLDNSMLLAAPNFGLKEIKFTPKPEVKLVTVHTFEIGAKVTLVEDTKLYSCHYDVIYDLSAGDTVTVVGHGVRPDNDAPLITITNDKGFATINPDYIAQPIVLEDGKAYQFDVRDKGGIVCGIYHEYDNKLHVGQAHYFDLMSATNIQLLEVKS